MSSETIQESIAPVVKRWKNRRGSLVMMLHDIQDTRGFVPREVALELAQAVGVPLAKIYEVLTFYNYFKLKAPGRAVISVCTGTACYLKGASDVLAAFKEELKIGEGETTADGNFHLQCVRCVGCCGLAPAVVINGRTHGKLKPADVRSVIGQWCDQLDLQCNEAQNGQK